MVGVEGTGYKGRQVTCKDKGVLWMVFSLIQVFVAVTEGNLDKEDLRNLRYDCG